MTQKYKKVFYYSPQIQIFSVLCTDSWRQTAKVSCLPFAVWRNVMLNLSIKTCIHPHRIYQIDLDFNSFFTGVVVVGGLRKRFLRHHIVILPIETWFPPEVRVTTKWTKTLYRDYLHRVANFCATVLNMLPREIISNNNRCRKRILKFKWNTWKYWWNETDGGILPVFAQFLWTLKFIFSSSHMGNCFWSCRNTGNYSYL